MRFLSVIIQHSMPKPENTRHDARVLDRDVSVSDTGSNYVGIRGSIGQSWSSWDVRVLDSCSG